MIYNFTSDYSFDTLEHQVFRDGVCVGMASPSWTNGELAGRIRMNFDIVASGEHYREVMGLIEKLRYLHGRSALEGNLQMDEVELHAPAVEEDCDLVVHEDGRTVPGKRYARRL